MSSIQSRINAFVALGNFLSQFSSKKIEKSSTVLFNELFFDGFIHQIKLAEEQNSWFTKEAILFSLDNWTSALTHENLNQWISNENAINSDEEQEPISDEIYYIVADKCTECVGFHEEPQCAAVCPVDCCVPDEDNVETEEELLGKQKFMHQD